MLKEDYEAAERTKADAEAAELVKVATQALNEAFGAANARGLKVEVGILEASSCNSGFMLPVLDVRVSKPL